jgi:hypothetical protein
MLILMSQPASERGGAGDRAFMAFREPRNWSIKRRSKSSRTASDPDSPLGCAMAASLDPG